MIDPSAYIASGAQVLGAVSLGARASVWYNSVLRADMEPITIGEETNIQDLSMIHVDEGVPCTIGARVAVGHRAILHGCTIEDDSLIGMGAILLNGVHVGTGSVVGAGAVLLEGATVPSGSLVLGVPGKVVRAVDAELRARITATVAHYVALTRRHRAGEFERHSM